MPNVWGNVRYALRQFRSSPVYAGAAVLTLAALAAPVETWRATAGYGIWAWMGAISAAEFLVRKTYFRNYYYRGPFERFWEKLSPAEAPPMGRRPAAYIRMVREQLGKDTGQR